MPRSEAYDAPEVRVVDGLYPLDSSQDVNRSCKPDESTSWSKAVQNQEAEAPRRKKWKTILVVAGVLAVAVIIGGAIGGAVGGTAATRKKANAVTTTITSYSATTASSTSSVSTGTSEITTDCPLSNGTTHQPLTPVGGTGSYNFVKYCGFDTTGLTLAEAFVPSFNDCIDMCSDFNYASGQDGANCFAVSFLVSGNRPGNCWAKGLGSILIPSTGLAAALRQQ